MGGHPFAMSVGTNAGAAPVSRIISGKETQYGEKSATASPSSKTAWQTLKTACLAPAVTITFSRETAARCSRTYFAAMASRSAASPATSVYFVRPASIARAPARPTKSGVGKSGSPIERSTTSTPVAASAFAFLPAAVVDDGSERADPPRKPPVRHPRSFHDRARAPKARIRFLPTASSPSSTTIHAVYTQTMSCRRDGFANWTIQSTKRPTAS